MTTKTPSPAAVALFSAIRDYIGRSVAPLAKRIKELEARQVLAYRGVWKQGELYQPGDAVTLKGGLWICNRPSTERPGDAAAGFTLAVKSGEAT